MHYELDFTPGERHSYCNADYTLLTYIIEQVSEQSYENYMQDHIFQPLGMMNTGVDYSRKLTTNRAAGYHMNKEFIQCDYANMSAMSGAAALYSTVEDLYLWDRALYTDTIVSKRTLDRMFTAYFPYYGGYGWDVSQVVRDGASKRRIAHLGQVEGFFSYWARYVDDDLTVIVLSNTDIAAVEELNDNLARVAFGEEVVAPHLQATIDVEQQGFVGVYVSEKNSNDKLTFTLEDGALYVSSNGWQYYPVHPVRVEDRSTLFIAEYIDERFIFLMNELHHVEKIIYTSANGDSTTYQIGG